MSQLISVNLPEKLANELYRLSKNLDKSRSELIKDALRAYIWEVKFRKIKKVVAGKAKARKIVTDDDVFKIVS